jgi:hypothetical protein
VVVTIAAPNTKWSHRDAFCRNHLRFSYRGRREVVSAQYPDGMDPALTFQYGLMWGSELPQIRSREGPEVDKGSQVNYAGRVQLENR